MTKQTPAPKKTIEKSVRAVENKEQDSSAGGAAEGRSTRRRVEGPTQRELYEQARRKGLPGRSRMTKAQLARALGR